MLLAIVAPASGMTSTGRVREVRFFAPSRQFPEPANRRSIHGQFGLSSSLAFVAPAGLGSLRGWRAKSATPSRMFIGGSAQLWTRIGVNDAHLCGY